MNGVIKKIFKLPDLRKEYGFITADDGKEYFFGKMQNGAIFDSLNERDKVTFDVEAGQKGPVAVNIARAA